MRASRREWIGLAVLALPTLLLSLDVSVLYLALPRLSADLGADSTQQLWILDIYPFLLAGFLVTLRTKAPAASESSTVEQERELVSAGH
jgi:MFS transporter, DHA2 family, multidrug resistance protein